ncbi:uncharacterized protein LOC110188835 [Drosophila serrata]|uniref:uncharacterized protein LOC110188835 n=1 Tax=Drosophila serrata TaxID=7274 RepID=UPI000A1D1D3A|nr:uncharacterized protein LOC110188835 [Drosophila serrata]XP_020814387.1 uncharacterized protein LOC110188835 [Drosophila serrata]
MPEDRKLALIITDDDPASDGVKTETVLGHLFQVIENGEAPMLRFSECVPMALFCGKMVIVCEDEVTFKWTICAINTMCQPHTATPFIKFYNLIRATTIVPVTPFCKPSCEIFRFLEVQNEGIVTDKWVLMQRCGLDPCACTNPMPPQNIFDNEVIELYMDQESKCIIESTCSKLKFIYWTIEFKFECS